MHTYVLGVRIVYRLSSIRRCSYYFFHYKFLCGYYFRGQLYFFRKPADTNDGWIRYVRSSDTVTTVRHCQQYSLSVLLSAMEMSHKIRTALVLAQSLLSESIHTRLYILILFLDFRFLNMNIAIMRAGRGPGRGPGTSRE